MNNTNKVNGILSGLEFKPDGTVLKKPVCAVEKCFDDAFIFAAGKWVCGSCAASIFKHRDKMVFEQQNAMFDAISKEKG